MNITNIHNIFLVESFKSDVIIRQSIGRGLRKHKTKFKLIIYDFVDDIRYYDEVSEKEIQNYIFKHGEHRISIYKEQKFPYTVKKIKF